MPATPLPSRDSFCGRGTLFATAREALPRSPAVELVDLSSLRTAAGPLLYARVAQGAYYELVGPPTASGVREVVGALERAVRNDRRRRGDRSGGGGGWNAGCNRGRGRSCSSRNDRRSRRRRCRVGAASDRRGVRRSRGSGTRRRRTDGDPRRPALSPRANLAKSWFATRPRSRFRAELHRTRSSGCESVAYDRCTSLPSPLRRSDASERSNRERLRGQSPPRSACRRSTCTRENAPRERDDASSIRPAPAPSSLSGSGTRCSR